MKKLSLDLNERLKKIQLLSDVETILDNQPEEDSSYYSYLENTYPIFMNIVDLFKHQYTDEELLVIANIIYFNKGTTQAIRTFLGYFGIEGTVTYSRIGIKLTSRLFNSEATSYSAFMDRFSELCKDLLIIQTLDNVLNKITIECTILNDLKTRVETVLINTIS